MSDLSYWLIFFSAALALNVSPGPDMIYIISRTLAQGTRIGIASSLGVCFGALFHVFAAGLGISAILATSAWAFALVKYVGAGYLIYLGIQIFRSSGTLLEIPQEKKQTITAWQAFRQGVLIDILNPKVAIFFMAFLPQFVRPELGNNTFQLIGLGLLVILVAIVVETGFVLAAARITTFLRNNTRASTWLDRALGSILIALGLRLAHSEG